LLNTGAREIIGNGDVKAVKLDSGKVLGCSLVVVGKGVSPNIRLLRDSGIETDKAVLVDSNMRASIDGVYAAGDVAQAYDIVEDAPRVNALWPCAVEQGLCAGENIAGAGREYRGSLAMNSVGFFGLSLVSMGRFNPRGDGDEAVSFINKEKATYKKLVFCGDRLVGGLFVGNIAGSGLYLRLIREKADISRIKDDLLDENISYARIRGLVEDKEKVYL
ncbi:MAG: FAD-dependent oxidoreductase, partial [Candidatus Omnitrophota bacterium]